jgi:hypothetical protein
MARPQFQPYEDSNIPQLRTNANGGGGNGCYGGTQAGKTFSWFADMATAGVAENERSKMVAREISQGPAIDASIPGATPSRWAGQVVGVGNFEFKAAKERLATVPDPSADTQQRALSTTLAAGGDFVSPAGSVPGFLASSFAAAARAESRILQALDARPLPSDAPMTLSVPRFATGTSAGTQVDGGAVSSTDITSALAQSPIGLIAGQQDVSQQLLDRFGGTGAHSISLDEVLAYELGRAYGEALDKECLNGNGSAGHLRGLLNVTGIVSRVYTDASPTPTKVFSQIMGLLSDQVAALGDNADVILLAPRRAFHLESAYAATNLDSFERLGIDVVSVPAMMTNLGAGTNEDRVIALDSDEVLLYLDQPSIRVDPDTLSGNMQVRFQCIGYASLMATRQPTATAILSGTGLSGPLTF